jgi:hypothetical protein
MSQNRETIDEAPPRPMIEDGPTPGETLPELHALPKEVGVMLLSAGVIGFVMPGPGAPAIIAGGLVLWPQGFGRVEAWVQRTFPDVHRTGMTQVRRYLRDLDRRYPWSRPRGNASEGMGAR